MEIDNQQRNDNLIFIGNTIVQNHLLPILEEYKNGSSLIELSSKYKYNIATIRYFLIKNNVAVRGVKESVKKFNKIASINIDEFLHENIIGWILGDGGLRVSKTALNPYFTYTDKKLSHIKYVNSILNSYNIKTNITQNKKSLCYQIQSESLPELHYYYNLFYGYEGLNEHNQKRKTLPNITFTPIILRNWYIGDGSSSPQNRSFNHRGSISCKYRNEFILDQFRNLFGDVKCYKYNIPTGTCHSYMFNNKCLIKLLEYIGDCPVEDYKYKWIVRRSTTIIEPTQEVEGIV